MGRFNSHSSNTSNPNVSRSIPPGERDAVMEDREQLKTPPPQDTKPKSNLIPPSPPPGKPSGLSVAMARLSDLTAQMEYQYAKHIQLTREHEMIKAQISLLQELPQGFDAFKEDLEKLELEKKAQREAAMAKEAEVEDSKPASKE